MEKGYSSLGKRWRSLGRGTQWLKRSGLARTVEGELGGAPMASVALRVWVRRRRERVSGQVSALGRGRSGERAGGISSRGGGGVALVSAHGCHAASRL